MQSLLYNNIVPRLYSVTEKFFLSYLIILFLSIFLLISLYTLKTIRRFIFVFKASSLFYFEIGETLIYRL